MTGSLSPQAIAKNLFVIDPDRDERASQLSMEALLTIASNNYSSPATELRSPKVRRFPIRCLLFGENFLRGETTSLHGLTAGEFGAYLAAGQDFQGSSNLGLASEALRNLLDPSTEQGQKGQHLMFPFHESLLWYDARPVAGKYGVRKVRMRGSGISLARILLDPPAAAGDEARESARRAIAGIRDALTQASPLSEIAMNLEESLPEEARRLPPLEDDEKEAWALPDTADIGEFSAALCRHAEGVMRQGGSSYPAMLWQLRTVFALDLAINALRKSWERVGAQEQGKWLLCAIPDAERQSDRVRLRSEKSYEDARTAIRWATISAIAEKMDELLSDDDVDWHQEFEGRTARVLDASVIQTLIHGGRSNNLRELGQLAFEGANYDRSGEGFRVLIESIGLSAGGTRYRYLSPSPDLLAALVGALSAEMPMTSSRFFSRISEDWRMIAAPDQTSNVAVQMGLDGADLARNARRLERLMIDAGLASGLSDRTVLVGEHAGRRTR